ncbi:MAG: alpha/beta fold hydrolase [Peptostreptococcaceae bacterium]
MSNIKSYKSTVEDGYFNGKENLSIYYRKYVIEESIASIVISHGFCESLERYEELINVFNENGFSVYAIDHRGHGRSGRLGVDDSQINVEKFEYYVEDLKTFLDEIVTENNNKLYLFAHSMGGAIGSMFLEKYDNYFERAILNAPMMEIDTGKYPQCFSKVIAKLAYITGQGHRYILNQGPFTGKEDLESSGTSCYDRYILYFNKQISNKQLQTAGGSFHWLNESFKAIKYITSEENAKNVKIPVLLFQAGKDTFVNSRGQNIFAKYASNCRVYEIKEAKHEIYIETDEIFNKYIEKVLSFYNK